MAWKGISSWTDTDCWILQVVRKMIVYAIHKALDDDDHDHHDDNDVSN